MKQALRVVHASERPAPTSDDGPQRLMSIMRIPDWMFERPGLGNITKEAVTYECQKCGIVEPRKFVNGYRRRECPCLWEQREFAGREAIRRELGVQRAAQAAR